MPEFEFSTFCHISQYGDQGYRELARMVAISRLTLWAPSSYMLKSDASALTSTTFLDYLNAGKIRVIGRVEWLRDPDSRKDNPWPGAAWDQTIDGEIRRICDQDEGKPKSERHVVIAPPESGYGFADRYLAQHPEQVSQWAKTLRGKKSSLDIPGGTREAALRESHPREAARRILRDAYNHGQAIAFSEADAPVLVQRKYTKFWNILRDAPPLDVATDSDSAQEPMSAPADHAVDWKMGNLANQLLRILAEFDIHARNHSDADSLGRFIDSAGREDVMKWFQGICVLLRDTPPSQLDGILVKRLRQEIGDGRFPGFWEGIKENRDESAVGAAALIPAALGLIADPTGLIGILPLALAVYPLGKGLLRQMGYVPDRFNGLQWPFLYTYGTRPSRRQVKQLRYVLNELYNRQSGGLSG